MRVVWWLLWVVLLLAVLLPLLRRRAVPPRRLAPTDQLVKDPVCQTYVVRSRAIRSEAGGAPVYFCSAECERRFERAEG
jgi:YHS domain-containing protein